MDIKHHYLPGKIEHGDIIIVYCPTKDMVGNVLTKAPPKPKHMKCLTIMGIIELRD
jgi:hypothetical protein